VSDTSQGPGWWLASDGMWYPPEMAQLPPPPESAREAMERGTRAGRRSSRPQTHHGQTPESGSSHARVPPPVGKKPVFKRWWFWTATVLAVVVIVAGIVWVSNKNNSTSSHTTNHAAALSSPSTTTTTAKYIQPTAFFSCSGSATGGVSITYGTNSSNQDGGRTLPWESYLPVTSTSQSFDVSAQLQGSGGSVTCTTLVYINGTRTTETGTTSRTRNVASAVVCSNAKGKWRPC
jgi:Mycobacterium membrane protein